MHAQTPVAYYPFNGNANDASGNSLNGTIIGSPTFTTDRFGNANSAIAFNGNTANRVEVADNALLRQPNITITAWVKVNTASGSIQTFVDKPLSPCTADSWHFGTENSNFSAWLFRTTGCGDLVQATSPLAINTWAYVAMTADASNQQLKLYINGSLVSTQAYAGTISYDNNAMYIGVSLENNANNYPLNGAIDELKIYSTILTAAQIEKEYSPVTPAPVAQYNFNGNVNDISGNNLHGTIIGSPAFIADRFGNTNRAISFNGNVANRVEVADNALLRPEAVTIAAWINLAIGSGIQTFVDKPLSPCYNDSWHFGTEGSNFSTWVSRSTSCGDFSQVTWPLPLNTWVHMAATADPISHQLKLYFNGVLSSTTSYSGAIPYDNNVMLFGAALENNGLAFPMNGALDDVMIFNTALTATQVLGVFNGEACNGIDDDSDGMIDETCTPTVSIANKTIVEGNSGISQVSMRITLNHPYDDTVSVRYKTANNTATAGSDYTAVNKILKFTPGQSSRTVTIDITGDTTFEANERFRVILLNPVNVIIGSNDTATVTITNDDEACNGIDDNGDGMIDETCIPTVSIANKSIDEGNSDTTAMTFSITLNHPYKDTVSVRYKTANKTATAGSDYVAVNKLLKLSPGQVRKNATVSVLGDVAVEPNEQFNVILISPVNTVLSSNDTAIGTIRNDDAASLMASNKNDIKNIVVKLAPNPAKDLLHITGLTAGTLIQVTDVQGRILLKQNVNNNAPVNISALTPGVYMLSYADGNNYKTVKFIKE